MPWYTTADARRDAERQGVQKEKVMKSQLPEPLCNLPKYCQEAIFKHVNAQLKAAAQMLTDFPPRWKIETREDEYESWLTLIAPNGNSISYSSQRGSIGAQILQDFGIAKTVRHDD